MKKQLNTALLFVTMLTACTSVKQIGKINMISNRNVDTDGSVKYQMITTYTGSDKRIIKKCRERTMDEAVDKVVRNVPGGEYLMNAKIYQVTTKLGRNKTYYAAEGDVWGIKK